MKTRLRYDRIIPIILILIAFIFFIVLLTKDDDNIFPLITEDFSSCELFNQNEKTLLRTDNDLYVLGESAELLHSVTLPSKDSLYTANGAYTLVADNKESTLFLYYKGEPIGSVALSGQIRNIFLNEEGGFCVILEEKAYMSKVLAFDRNCKELFSYLHDTFYFLSAHLAQDQKTIVLSMIDFTQQTLCSELRVYDISAEEAILLWNTVYSDEIITGVELLDSGKVTLLSDKRLTHFKKDGTVIFNQDFTGKNLMFAEFRNEDYFFLAFENGTATDFQIFNKKGKMTGSFTIADAVSKVNMEGKYLCLYCNDVIYLINHKGIAKTQDKAEALYSDIVLCNDRKHVVLISETYIEKLKIR